MIFTRGQVLSGVAFLVSALIAVIWTFTTGRITALETTTDAQENRLSHVETRVDDLHEGQARIERKLEALDSFLRAQQPTSFRTAH